MVRREASVFQALMSVFDGIDNVAGRQYVQYLLEPLTGVTLPRLEPAPVLFERGLTIVYGISFGEAVLRYRPLPAKRSRS
jgi:hypothetical protein